MSALAEGASGQGGRPGGRGRGEGRGRGRGRGGAAPERTAQQARLLDHAESPGSRCVTSSLNPQASCTPRTISLQGVPGRKARGRGAAGSGCGCRAPALRPQPNGAAAAATGTAGTSAASLSSTRPPLPLHPPERAPGPVPALVGVRFRERLTPALWRLASRSVSESRKARRGLRKGKRSRAGWGLRDREEKLQGRASTDFAEAHLDLVPEFGWELGSWVHTALLGCENLWALDTSGPSPISELLRLITTKVKAIWA
ncbi:hypothetical protein GH733_005106, partial [Mirounga leonina]